MPLTSAYLDENFLEYAEYGLQPMLAEAGRKGEVLKL